MQAVSSLLGTEPADHPNHQLQAFPTTSLGDAFASANTVSASTFNAPPGSIVPPLGYQWDQPNPDPLDPVSSPLLV